MKKSLFILILLAALAVACESEEITPECIAPAQLVTLEPSENSKKWIPEAYQNLTTTVRFVSKNGTERVFQVDTVFTENLSSQEVIMPCTNNSADSIAVAATPFYQAIYLTTEPASDSLVLLLTLQTQVKNLQYQDIFSARLSKVELLGSIDNFGRIELTTDVRTASESVDNQSVFNQQISIAGKIFDSVYSSPLAPQLGSDIFYQPETGLVGFIDENGVEWALTE